MAPAIVQMAFDSNGRYHTYVTNLVDSYSRTHRTLRISVTDRCQMKCTYCLPNGAPPPLPREDILTFEEIARVARVGASLGVTRLRITGGEPLLRRQLDRLFTLLRPIPGVVELALTTNGLLLAPQLPRLMASGLTHLCISIDSLDRERFRAHTGCDALDTVLTAIEAARACPHLTVELNAVAIRGKSEQDIPSLVDFGRTHDMPVRFIELMPFEDIAWSPNLVISGAEIEQILAAHYGPNTWDEVSRSRPAAPARRFRFRDGRGGFGLIEPVSNPFCASCDRMRLRSDGMLYNCLFDRHGIDLRSLMRSSSDAVAGDVSLQAAFQECVAKKGPGGMVELQQQVASPARIMASIGG